MKIKSEALRILNYRKPYLLLFQGSPISSGGRKVCAKHVKFILNYKFISKLEIYQKKSAHFGGEINRLH
jgi:hypothetical protein